MNRADYIDWYKDHYGHPPKPALLDKYYPIEQQEDEIPDPTPEELEKFWREE